MSKSTVRYLNENEYAKWDDYVLNNPQGTLFHTALWLQKLCSYNNLGFKILCSFDSEEKIMGGIAFGHKKKFGLFNIIEIPKTTLYSGILHTERKSNYISKLETFKFGIQEQILKKLNEEFSYINLFSNIEDSDLRAYKWDEFSFLPKYTYMATLVDSRKMYEQFSPSLKRQINKGRKQNPVIQKFPDSDLTKHYQLLNETHKRQSLEMQFRKEDFEDLFNTLYKEGFVELYQIRADNDIIITSFAILKYKGISYYWSIANNSDYFNSGLSQFMLFEILNDLKQETIEKFDFVGANTPSIIRYKSQFNFELKQYFYLTKVKGKVIKTLDHIKKIIH